MSRLVSCRKLRSSHGDSQKLRSWSRWWMFNQPHVLEQIRWTEILQHWNGASSALNGWILSWRPNIQSQRNFLALQQLPEIGDPRMCRRIHECHEGENENTPEIFRSQVSQRSDSNAWWPNWGTLDLSRPTGTRKQNDLRWNLRSQESNLEFVQRQSENKRAYRCSASQPETLKSEWEEFLIICFNILFPVLLIVIFFEKFLWHDNLLA